MKKIGKTIGVLLGLTALAGGIVVGTVPSVREKARDWTLSVGESVKDTWNDLFDTVPGGSTGGNVDEVPGGDESELPGEDVGEQPGEDVDQSENSIFEIRQQQLIILKKYLEQALLVNERTSRIDNSKVISSVQVADINYDGTFFECINYTDGTFYVSCSYFSSDFEGVSNFEDIVKRIYDGETFSNEEFIDITEYMKTAFYFTTPIVKDNYKITVNEEIMYVWLVETFEENFVSSYLAYVVYGNNLYSCHLYYSSKVDSTILKNEICQYVLDQNFKGEYIGSDELAAMTFDVLNIKISESFVENHNDDVKGYLLNYFNSSTTLGKLYDDSCFIDVQSVSDGDNVFGLSKVESEEFSPYYFVSGNNGLGGYNSFDNNVNYASFTLLGDNRYIYVFLADDTYVTCYIANIDSLYKVTESGENVDDLCIEGANYLKQYAGQKLEDGTTFNYDWSSVKIMELKLKL